MQFFLVFFFVVVVFGTSFWPFISSIFENSLADRVRCLRVPRLVLWSSLRFRCRKAIRCPPSVGGASFLPGMRSPSLASSLPCYTSLRGTSLCYVRRLISTCNGTPEQTRRAPIALLFSVKGPVLVFPLPRVKRERPRGSIAHSSPPNSAVQEHPPSPPSPW
ncbi:hypothetical protein LX36DRAFT_54677 [Colletotrichum falcatum]|nr:hypothetical protein LX36DRAFT_54677 [Colletotrichum falcatum]